MIKILLESFNAESTIKDFGLRRLSFLVIIYNLFLSLWCFSLLGKVFYQNYFLLFLCGILLFFRNKIVAQGKYFLMGAHILLLVSQMWWDYEVVGCIDQAVGGFPRFDAWAASIDQMIFGGIPSLWLQNFLANISPLDKYVYDVLMLSYILYFLLPFLVMFIFFFEVKEDSIHFVGRILSSYLLFFMMNFVCYLLVPISGPQHYFENLYTSPLPFSFMGNGLHHMVWILRNNFIDCFPSGHAGLSMLATFWMYQLKLPKRKFAAILTLLICIAIIALRYHYLVDALASVLLIFLSYFLARFFYPFGNPEMEKTL